MRTHDGPVGQTGLPAAGRQSRGAWELQNVSRSAIWIVRARFA